MNQEAATAADAAGITASAAAAAEVSCTTRCGGIALVAEDAVKNALKAGETRRDVAMRFRYSF